MNDSVLYNYAVQLCSADHISGFIPAQPITDTRDNITEQRLFRLFKLIGSIHNDICETYFDRCQDTVSFVFEKALQLTCSDISCGVIAVEPILYDRDEKIGDTLKVYFSKIILQLENNGITTANSINNHETCASKELTDTNTALALPVHKVMKKKKYKKR